MTEAKASESAEFSLPFVWPSLSNGAGPGSDDDGFPFDTCDSDIMGIVSDLNDRGVKWLKERKDHKIRVIVAVYSGCRTRSQHLNELLRFQEERKGNVEFHILPKTGRATGTPANCLAAIPSDKGNPVFLFGSRPNFGISAPDPTQFSMIFRADLALASVWKCWFDSTWKKASLLTKSTADIPPLVPASGSSDAAALWGEYCSRCTESEPNQESPDNTSTQTPSEFVGMPKSDKLVDRVMRLLGRGRQVTIAHDKVVKPIEVPVSPRLFHQDSEIRERTVIQRQSFRISAFSKKELKMFEEYRKASQTIVKKLSLPLGTGLYWMPDNMIPILEREFEVKEKEAKDFLSDLVGSDSDKFDAHIFVNKKRDQIEHDLRATHIRIGGKGDLRQATLTEVIHELEQRINKAFESPILTPVTYSKVMFDLQEKGSQKVEAPWAQVEKLILALTRFPREVITKPKSLSGLVTPPAEILEAMNIEKDKIIELKKENTTKAEEISSWHLKMMIPQIEGPSIMEKNRCNACFMIIDGKTPKEIESSLSRKLL